MRVYLLVALVAALVLGCARGPTAPPIPGSDDPADTRMTSVIERPDGPYRLWGEWTFFINDNHDRVDVVPKRDAHFHLNALKFLEDHCRNCLEIVSVRSNGDGTVDLTIRLTHPFPDRPEYTGFDVKGIIMFNGSLEYDKDSDALRNIPVEGPLFRVSWKELGDPEVLNADGWTFRWNPEYDSGSSQPIFNYWQGRFSNGIPNAHLNGYLNFYSREERHIFESHARVERTYRIWLPPGPVVVGYAVEACWEPPTVVPVTDPVNDFPISANQPEPYVFNVLVNNGNPVTDCERCCWDDCEEFRSRIKQWSGPLVNMMYVKFPPPVDTGVGGNGVEPCPDYDGWYSSWAGVTYLCKHGNGTHRFFGYIFHFKGGVTSCAAWTLFDVVVDDPDLD